MEKKEVARIVAIAQSMGLNTDGWEDRVPIMKDDLADHLTGDDEITVVPTDDQLERLSIQAVSDYANDSVRAACWEYAAGDALDKLRGGK